MISSRRARLFLSLAVCASVMAAGCRRGPPPGDGGASVARRVVSLAPNLTEIVFAVGAGDRLVGVSDYSDYPPAAQSIPRVGGLEVSTERVVSLSPDLVLATPEGNAKGPVSALAAAGIPLLVVPGSSLKDVLEAIRLIGRRLGRGQAAERLADELDARRRAVESARAGKPRPTALLLVWPDPPQAAGGRTFLDDVLVQAGARNILAERHGWPLVSSEWLAATPVDVLVIPDSEQTHAAYAGAFASGPLSRGAIARARVVRIDESTLTRPGPRVFDALERLAQELSR